MIKQVIVVRSDLNMRKGKIAAQASHASMKVFFDRILEQPSFTRDGIRVLPTTITIPLQGFEPQWVFGQFTKIVVQGDSESHLKDLEAAAKAAGVPCALIVDSGATEFHGVPTVTALAVGPAEASLVDAITGALRLY